MFDANKFASPKLNAKYIVIGPHAGYDKGTALTLVEEHNEQFAMFTDGTNRRYVKLNRVQLVK